MWRSLEARYENFESIRRPLFSRLAPTPLRLYALQYAFVFPDKHSYDPNRKDRDCQQSNCKNSRNIPKFRIFHTGHRFTNQERHCIRNVLPWTELEPRPLSHAMWHSVSKHQKGWYIVDISTHRYGLFYCRSNIVSAFDRLCNFVTVHDLIWIRKSENTATLKVSQVSTMYCLHLLLTTILKHEIL